jgi:hypothetical protein
MSSKSLAFGLSGVVLSASTCFFCSSNFNLSASNFVVASFVALVNISLKESVAFFEAADFASSAAASANSSSAFAFASAACRSSYVLAFCKASVLAFSAASFLLRKA